MPLITCPDCSKEVSDLAPACPSCGRPMQDPPKPKKKNRALAATLNVLGLTGIILGVLTWLPAGPAVGASLLVGGLVLRATGEMLDRVSKVEGGLP